MGGRYPYPAGYIALLVGLSIVVWSAFRVRRSDALNLHVYVYAFGGAVLAFGVRWVSGFGLLALIFSPIGALLAVLDASSASSNGRSEGDGGNHARAYDVPERDNFPVTSNGAT